MYVQCSVYFKVILVPITFSTFYLLKIMSFSLCVSLFINHHPQSQFLIIFLVKCKLYINLVFIIFVAW